MRFGRRGRFGASFSAGIVPAFLVPSCGALPSSLTTYLSGVKGSATAGWLYGGAAAVGDDVLAALEQAA